MTEVVTSRRHRRKRQKKLTFTGILGEILITIGVVVLLYVVWQLWIGDAIVDARSKSEAAGISHSWEEAAKENPFTTEVSPKESKFNTVTAPPPVIEKPDNGEVFAQVYIPRLFGTDAFSIAGGTDPETSLNVGMMGHYDSTVMPGDDGNFAFAGHRSGPWGAPLKDMPKMHVGDAIVVETEAGWYTYRYRSMEYVWPTATDVLVATPQDPAAGITGKYLTMTTCSPRFGIAERLIGYAVFESFTPRTADGKKPASLQPVEVN